MKVIVLIAEVDGNDLKIVVTTPENLKHEERALTVWLEEKEFEANNNDNDDDEDNEEDLYIFSSITELKFDISPYGAVLDELEQFREEIAAQCSNVGPNEIFDDIEIKI